MISRSATEVKLPDDLKAALLGLCKDIDKEDEEPYNEIVRVCSELEQYWKGNQFLFWDGNIYHTARDLNEEDYEEFERIVNIYKAHGESIVAALSSEVPSVGFYPADAKNPDDVMTATAYTKMSRVVAQENRAPLLLVKALATLFNNHLIAGYNYHERSEKYGFIEVEEIETELVDVPDFETVVNPLTQQPEQVQVGTHPEEKILRQEMKQYPKGKEKLKVFGPPFIKLPMYVQSQDECGYVRLSYEVSRGMANSLYKRSFKKGNDSGDVAYEQRMSILYGGFEPTNLITVKMYWIRPWYFHNLDDVDIADKLDAKFKNGAFAIVIQNEIIQTYAEPLDEHWTISENPLHTYIYADPIGKSLKPVQDKRNEEDRLVTQTLRHGIPFTVADAEALNFDQFKKQGAKPGDIFPAKAPFGKALADGFHSVKTATVPQEITQIAERTDQAGQFVVGSYPSIYGGPSEGGSRTYAEYAASRNMALQRLSVYWRIVVDWWTRMMERAVESRMKNLDEDEAFTEKGSGDFITTFIKTSELNGKIGRVVSETSERLPMSWLQKKDQIMELFQLNNENINAALFHPENVNLLAMLFGFPELFIPGSDQRLKQLNEINDLVESEPIVNPDNQGGMQTQSTVAVEDGVDDHFIHSETCQAWLVSERGQLLRRENPAAYQNVVAHKKEHDAFVAQAQMMQQQQEQANNEESDNVKENENA